MWNNNYNNNDDNNNSKAFFVKAWHGGVRVGDTELGGRKEEEKSRMGNAQTRDKAPGEDCTLEGDSDREDDEEEEEEKENGDSFDQGTSVDYPGTGGDSGNTKDPSPDASKQNGGHKTVVQPSDTTRSELENKHGGLYPAYEPVKEKCTTDYSSGLGRRATLPFATDTPRSIFSEGKRPKLPVEPKVVKFTDQERPGRPLSDGSPDKKLVLNAQENAVRIHFVKDITIQSPNAGAPTPTEAEESPPLPGSLPGNKLPLTRSKSEPAESPKRDSLPSPATPVEDLLFSLGYTKVDVIEIPRRSVALSNQDQASLEKRPEKTSTDAAPEKTTLGGKPDTKTTTVNSTPDKKPAILGKPDIKPVVPCKPDNKPIISSKPDNKPVVPSKPDSKPIISGKPDSKPMLASQPDDKPIISSKSESETTIDSKPDNKPIVPSKPDNKPIIDSKPDNKTTFDSKPEKNVISGHKHENKPQHEKPSAEEKEKKPSKKVTMQVKEEKPKEHVKLFPWKVEFSTKPKPMTPVSRDEDWRSEEKPVQWSGGKSKEDGSKKHGSKSSKGDTPPVVEPPKKHRGLHLPFRKDKTDKHKHEVFVVK
nr:hypothetical protein BaRGS_030992 [Batillaria attramentaria]